mgnify:CR=1 FL=1
MKIAISQPTFLPWQGYFALIDYVDEFIFLDHVQFVKRSWMQRNKIKSNNEELMISVPVETKGKRYQALKDVKVNLNHYDCNKIIKTLCTNYSKSKFFDKYFSSIKEIFLNEQTYLCNLNIALIKIIASQIGIKTKFLNSQNLIEKKLEKIELLSYLSNKRKAKEYISTIGSKVYFGDLKKFPNTDINIMYYEYNHKLYKQQKKNFITFLSIMDLLFNEGPNTIKILRQNFKLIK